MQPSAMTMTMAVRRVLGFASIKAPFSESQSKCKLALYSPFSSSSLRIFRLEDGSFGEKFPLLHNGGGTFHDSASIDSTALVEVGVVVHSESIVGPNVRIGSGTIVGPSVTIALSTNIGYNVALSNCCIGDSRVIHNGVCIGQDGFGFYVDGDGNMIKKPQMLNVIIGNNVEIGANTCIDRGSIGDYVTMEGRVAVRDHVSIISKVWLAAASCVTKDIKEPGDYGGFPAVMI